MGEKEKEERKRERRGREKESLEGYIWEKKRCKRGIG